MRDRISSKRKWVYIVILCIILLIVSVMSIIAYCDKQKDTTVYEDLEKDVITERIDNTDEQTETEVLLRNPTKEIDFVKLWEMNKEVYAWIEVPGTEISYPVLQHAGEDDYYLEYTIEHEKNRSGAVYSEKSSARDFSGFVHILYGHNMRNESMFGSLKRYMEKDFMDENPYIYIYTPDKTYIYEIFAGVVHSDAHLMYKYDFVTQEGQQEYIDTILAMKADSRNQFREEAEVTPQNKLLVLSTCVSGEGEKRYLVNAVLVEEISRN